ncbi:hypothetical protein Krad_1690 [Kineococcus radiotolerans SRS30216 = ATCC BAA-149]|uniref:Uncharacterized protein n=1 Tax=Kineococcus radiotolerans (strain ATCC BAA-149 / DSM 14245 / SRS30216) TaxID=266940 RepID=A6W8N7_KINRD|nr:hypothetical protein Krad_1690 [Kineococcus radiotolerans SRS30216 = ATCC BAA-149]
MTHRTPLDRGLSRDQLAHVVTSLPEPEPEDLGPWVDHDFLVGLTVTDFHVEDQDAFRRFWLNDRVGAQAPRPEDLTRGPGMGGGA